MAKEKRKVIRRELFARCPPGYRATTADEERLILDTGMRVRENNSTIRLLNAQLAQHEAELKATRLELQNALSGAMLIDRQRKELHETLRIQGKPGDIHEDGGRIYICVDATKRIDPARPGPAPAQKPASVEGTDKPPAIEVKTGNGKVVELG